MCAKHAWISREQYQVYEDSIDHGSMKVKCFNCAKLDLAKSDIVSLDVRPGTYRYVDGTTVGPYDGNN